MHDKFQTLSRLLAGLNKSEQTQLIQCPPNFVQETETEHHNCFYKYNASAPVHGLQQHLNDGIKMPSNLLPSDKDEAGHFSDKQNYL